ncbi:GNAT family N-acetyltransferase [Roseomonas populi]|uniref:GNAT family N-acetyltransferase n=1 Tax=Roseomonas populi TaxID=3121582 RepID=A0ABT1X4J1_9PROT|nr:GNAT family N-acetyltransferase [Roseomonas pecuniae]MCR0983031.1 GNAT family N-acetyltransferase [Roseomonas pecuniae]
MSALRPAKPEDEATIRALVERAYAPYVPLLGRRPAPMDDDFAARIAQGQAHVMERDGALVALAVIEDRADHLWIEDLAVEPGLHGQGIGRALLAFAEGEARRLGLRELRLLTNERMERNRAIYARAGFQETERREEMGFRRVYMVRHLDPA